MNAEHETADDAALIRYTLSHADILDTHARDDTAFMLLVALLVQALCIGSFALGVAVGVALAVGRMR
jgi:hypothetical protein